MKRYRQSLETPVETPSISCGAMRGYSVVRGAAQDGSVKWLILPVPFTSTDAPQFVRVQGDCIPTNCAVYLEDVGCPDTFYYNKDCDCGEILENR